MERTPEPFDRLAALDKTVHEPARLAILTALSAYPSCDSVSLQALTALTKGNLSNHLQKLEHAGLVCIDKRFRGRMPQTVLALTRDGREAIDDHWTPAYDHG